MNIVFFGSSLVSAYWNGAATYYRGIIRALHQRGHRITFYESDAYERQKHRDIDDPPWARVVVYSSRGTEAVRRCLDEAKSADLIVKTSGVGVFDELLEAAVLELKRPDNLVAFWDVDAPATLDRVAGCGLRVQGSASDLNPEPRTLNPSDEPRTVNRSVDPFLKLVPEYDLILTYGGGEPVVRAYLALGARRCVPIYNGLDPSTHYPVPAQERFKGDLGFLGNRLPDRERRVEQFFLEPAAQLPGRRFLLGGSGWRDKPMPANVNYIGHVYTRDHNAFNCTPLTVLNISRESMARYGFSPATRVFEAAGAGACLITDWFEGIEMFLEPGREVLVARDGDEVTEHLGSLTADRAREIGTAALKRVLAEHTYAHRAELLDEVLEGEGSGRSAVGSGQVSALPTFQIVIIGLSITSSWGNGHATTYRGLVRELVRRGHDVLFLEHDKPWYAANRDMPRPAWGRTELYQSVDELKRRFADDVRHADFVMVGSYVPEGNSVGQWALETARGPVGFYDIDTPVTMAQLARGQCEYLTPELIRRYAVYLSFTGGPTLEKLERAYGSPRARPLYCSVDPQLYYPDAGETRWDLGYLGTYSADRQPALQRLLIEPAQRWRAGRFVVAGPQYPAQIGWPVNVERIQHLEPVRHRAFYNEQRFTLNLTRREMVRAGYSPSVRLFEAAACGAAIISDWWEGLDDFFAPGREIFIAHDTEQALRIIRETDDAQRRSAGEAARQRVLASHTAAHRAAELETCVSELLAGRS